MSKNRQRPKAGPGTGRPSVTKANPVRAKKRVGIQETEFLGRFLDPGFIALTVLGFAVTIAAVVVLAPSTQDPLAWYLALFAAPTLPTLWSVFTALRQEKEIGPRYALVLGRLLGLPFLLSLPMAVVGVVVTVIPSIAAQIAQVRAAGIHPAFPEENGPAAGLVFVLSGLVGGGAAMLAATLVWIFVLIPYSALREPQGLAAVALFDHRLFTSEQGKPVGRAFAILIMLTIAIPTLMVVGAKYMDAQHYSQTVGNFLLFLSEPARYWADAAWLVGAMLIPVAVAATIVIWVKMRQLDPHGS